METGTVVTKTSKGFGFIQSASGEDVFVHCSAVGHKAWADLCEGDRVEYEIADTPKGSRATNVRRVN